MLNDDEFERAIREIDEELRAEGIPPHARGFNAVRKFGQRYKLSMPFNRPNPGAPQELFDNWPYSEKIFLWFSDIYGQRNKIDPSAGRRVAVLADEDIWELRLPLFWGRLEPVVERKLTEPEQVISRGLRRHNISNGLTNITTKRLERFSDADADEMVGQFVVGLDVCRAIDRFRAEHTFFAEAQSDLATAVATLVAQNPSYGQSRWASQQFAEKYLKGVANFIGLTPPKNHKLSGLHDQFATKITGMNLRKLISSVECSAAVRYGEQASSRAEAYAAHKSSLLLVRGVVNSLE